MSTSMDVNDFHSERIEAIRSRSNLPTLLIDQPAIVAHLIPEEREANGFLDSTEDLPDPPTISDIVGGFNRYSTADGRIVRQTASDEDQPYVYGYIDNSGWYEAVQTRYARFDGVYPGVAVDVDSVEAIQEACTKLEEVGVQPPLYAIVSVLGYSGVEFGVPDRISKPITTPRIPGDELISARGTISSYSDDIPLSMKPVLDSIWEASGWTNGSINYNDSGKWDPY